MRSTLHWLLMLTAATAAACSSDSGPNDGGNDPVGTVTVGNIFFRSEHNGTQNPAVDTIAAGTMVTWIWTSTGNTPHSVQPVGEPRFTGSDLLTGNGMTYTLAFTAPGTYHYDCAIHRDAMTGTIVVQ